MKIKITEIKKFFSKVFKKVFNKPAYLFLALILVDAIIGAVLFFNFILFSDIKKKSDPLLVLNKNGLDGFVAQWIKQEQNFILAQNVDCRDIFLGFFEPKNQSVSTSTQIK